MPAIVSGAGLSRPVLLFALAGGLILATTLCALGLLRHCGVFRNGARRLGRMFLS